MVNIQTLYGHLKTLTKQWFYDKSEIDTALELKADATDIPDVSDVIRTSETTGLVKNDGTIDTTTYLSEHQSLANYIEKSNTTGLVKNDGTIDTTTYLSEHQDISGKANSADLATVATSGSYTDLIDIPATFAPSSHGHATSEVTDANAYTHLQTAANSTQAAINSAIDSKIGSLLSVELIEVVTTLPTAASSTMNKLYMKPESTSATNDAYEIFVTVKTADEVEQGAEQTYSYAWEKVDTARIDLSGKADVSHTHGNITNDGKVGSNANYFVSTTTGGAITSQQKIGNIDTSGAIGSTSGKVCVTTTNGVVTTSDWVDEIDGVINDLISYGTSLES